MLSGPTAKVFPRTSKFDDPFHEPLSCDMGNRKTSICQVQNPKSTLSGMQSYLVANLYKGISVTTPFPR